MAAKILCVDDEADILGLLGAILHMAGYQPLAAATAAEALGLLCERPDLVVLDVNLPDMDGIECCRRLRQRAPHLPVLFLTATTSSRRAEALAAGGGAFLQKPFDPDTLRDAIARLLDGRLERRGGDDRRQHRRPHDRPDRRKGERRGAACRTEALAARTSPGAAAPQGDKHPPDGPYAG